MVHYLSGGSEQAPNTYYGRKVGDAYFGDDHFYIEFEDGLKIDIFDNGQSCCESRFMTCDDNPADLVGGKLLRIEIKDADYSGSEYDVHEESFLEIATDKGHIVIANHNIHNGYYGGFGLTIKEVGYVPR